MFAYRRLFVIAAAVVAPVAFAAKPDIENGKTTFNTICSVCHSVQKEGGPVIGPNLLGVVGRKSGSQPDFQIYTPALKAAKITWSKKTLDKFLLDPNTNVKGTTMLVMIQDKKTRADVVAYLATLKK